MIQSTYQLQLTFEQILDLVKQLNDSEKLQLSKELEKDTLNPRITQLSEEFKTDELPVETLTEEVEIVRTEMDEEKQGNTEHQQNAWDILVSMVGTVEAPDQDLKAKKPFQETQLTQVAGCLKYQGEPKTIEAFNEAIRLGIEELWNDRS